MNDITEKIVYVLGNGFDIAANLPTRYTDFMLLLEKWDVFYSNYQKCCEERKKTEYINCPREGKLTEESLEEYAQSGLLYNKENIDKMNKIITSNGWVKYFQHCQYKENGWAGFENEIKEALRIIDRMMIYNMYKGFGQMSAHEKAVFAMHQKIMYSIDTLSEGSYFKTPSDAEETAKLRKNFINRVAIDLIGFTEIFRLYLVEFIERMKTEKDPGIIHNEKTQTFVISLNYTHNQITKSGIADNCVHMIHGSDSIENNLVMGIDNDEQFNNEFIRFKKFFQRIQKQTGAVYKKFFELIPRGVSEKPIKYKVVFFGHSLDPIDADFIKDVFGLSRSSIYIHYCNQQDYEQKVINCVEIFGADYIIEAVANKTIVFTDKNLSIIPAID